MSAPPSTRTNMRLDGNKFQRCQSALSHYRKRPPAGGSKAHMDCEPFMPDALRDCLAVAHSALDFSRKESVRGGSAAMEFELIDTGLFDFLLRHHRASPDIESIAGCLRQECRWWVVG